MNDKVFVFLAEGFEVVEALTPVDVLRRANIDITTVSISNSKLVTASAGVTITADSLFSETNFDDAQMLILPGGLPGTTNLNNFKPLKDLLLKASTKGKFIGAICAAPLILGQLNLLKGKKATCNNGFEDQLLEATFTGSSVELSDNIVTSNGVGSSMKFAIQLVSLLKGVEFADELTKKMLV